MPKAAIHKNNFPMTRKNKVGATRQVAAVKSIAIASAMNEAVDDQFGRGVAPLDQSYALAALLRGWSIVHARPAVEVMGTVEFKPRLSLPAPSVYYQFVAALPSSRFQLLR